MIEGSNADALLGLTAMRIVATEIGSEVTITIETTSDRVGCRSCGVIAKAHGRRRVRGGIWRRGDARLCWCG